MGWIYNNWTSSNEFFHIDGTKTSQYLSHSDNINYQRSKTYHYTIPVSISNDVTSLDKDGAFKIVINYNNDNFNISPIITNSHGIATLSVFTTLDYDSTYHLMGLSTNFNDFTNSEINLTGSTLHENEFSINGYSMYNFVTQSKGWSIDYDTSSDNDTNCGSYKYIWHDECIDSTYSIHKDTVVPYCGMLRAYDNKLQYYLTKGNLGYNTISVYETDENGNIKKDENNNPQTKPIEGPITFSDLIYDNTSYRELIEFETILCNNKLSYLPLGVNTNIGNRTSLNNTNVNNSNYGIDNDYYLRKLSKVNLDITKNYIFYLNYTSSDINDINIYTKKNKRNNLDVVYNPTKNINIYNNIFRNDTTNIDVDTSLYDISEWDNNYESHHVLLTYDNNKWKIKSLSSYNNTVYYTKTNSGYKFFGCDYQKNKSSYIKKTFNIIRPNNNGSFPYIMDNNSDCLYVMLENGTITRGVPFSVSEPINKSTYSTFFEYKISENDYTSSRTCSDKYDNNPGNPGKVISKEDNNIYFITESNIFLSEISTNSDIIYIDKLNTNPVTIEGHKKDNIEYETISYILEQIENNYFSNKKNNSGSVQTIPLQNGQYPQFSIENFLCKLFITFNNVGQKISTISYIHSSGASTVSDDKSYVIDDGYNLITNYTYSNNGYTFSSFVSTSATSNNGWLNVTYSISTEPILDKEIRGIFNETLSINSQFNISAIDILRSTNNNYNFLASSLTLEKKNDIYFDSYEPMTTVSLMYETWISDNETVSTKDVFIIPKDLVDKDIDFNENIMLFDGTTSIYNYTSSLKYSNVDTNIFLINTATNSTWVTYSESRKISNDKFNPIGGKNIQKSDSLYKSNNFLTTFVDYSSYNLDFKCTISDAELSVYTANGVVQSLSYEGDNSALLKDLTLIDNIDKSSFIKTKGDGTTYSENWLTLSYYNIRGGNNLYFIASAKGTNSWVTISDIYIQGGYADEYYTISDTNLSPYNPSVSYNYTVDSSDDNGNTNIYSNIGSGYYKAGIWHDGVWNNGLRDDRDFNILNNVIQYIADDNKLDYYIILSGSNYVVNKYEVGDKVSLGNIVAIDINDNRKFFSKEFIIYAIDTENNTITVKYTLDFPIKEIKRDSEYHRIYISKNVWLNGIFFNGRFTGIWNNGMFKGYPFITEMQNVNWIQGIYDGGKFSTNIWDSGEMSFGEYKKNSQTYQTAKIQKYYIYDNVSVNDGSPNILDTKVQLNFFYKLGESTTSDYSIELSDKITYDGTTYSYNGKEYTILDYTTIENIKYIDNNIYGVTNSNNYTSSNIVKYNLSISTSTNTEIKVKLETSDAILSDKEIDMIHQSYMHNLAVGDKLILNINNISYETEVVEIIDDCIVNTNLQYNNELFVLDSLIQVKCDIHYGLIQDMTFKSNNISTITTKDSKNSSDIFLYNSFLDVVYEDDSSVNIGKEYNTTNLPYIDDVSLLRTTASIEGVLNANTIYNSNPNQIQSSRFLLDKNKFTDIADQTKTFKVIKQDKQKITENNLYGYPTKDVLSSVAYFRNSFDNNIKTYNLGVKYKIYHNFIGESGEFKEYIEGDSISDYMLKNGWTSSTYPNSTITFERIVNNPVVDNLENSDTIADKKLKVIVTNKGGVLNLDNNYLKKNDLTIKDRYAEDVKPNRYTFVKFDLISADIAQCSDNATSRSDYFPKIHFNNINVKRNVNTTTPGQLSYFTIEPSNFVKHGGESLHQISVVNHKTPIRIYDDGVNITDEQMTFLPVNENIEHTTVLGTHMDFFYNKTELGMTFRGGDGTVVQTSNNKILPVLSVATKLRPQLFTKTTLQPNLIKNISKQVFSPDLNLNTRFNSVVNTKANNISTYVIDNLEFCEVDMIPFFSYFDYTNTDLHIDKSVAVPYYGVASYKEYDNNSELQGFVSNNSVNYDSVYTTLVGQSQPQNTSKLMLTYNNDLTAVGDKLDSLKLKNSKNIKIGVYNLNINSK